MLLLLSTEANATNVFPIKLRTRALAVERMQTLPQNPTLSLQQLNREKFPHPSRPETTIISPI